MDHNQATQLTAVEKYLLDELPPELRDEFEEHFFDCQECATDLRATAGFIGRGKEGISSESSSQTPGGDRRQNRALSRSGRSALVWSALAASLLVIAYQNMVVYPRFKTEIAELKLRRFYPPSRWSAATAAGARFLRPR